MPFVDEHNKPLGKKFLRELGEQQRLDREREEAIRIEVAKKMGILDENGNAVNPDEFEEEENFTPEAVPPARADVGLICRSCHEVVSALAAGLCSSCMHLTKPPKADDILADDSHPYETAPTPYETMEVLMRIANEDADPAFLLETIRDIIANPAKYRLEE